MSITSDIYGETRGGYILATIFRWGSLVFREGGIMFLARHVLVTGIVVSGVRKDERNGIQLDARAFTNVTGTLAEGRPPRRSRPRLVAHTRHEHTTHGTHTIGA